jgi:triosephosphate isomerase
MNTNLDSCAQLLQELSQGWSGVHKAEVAVCPPFPYLGKAADVLEDSNIAYGAQDVCEHASGAYTGQVSTEMLLDFGCKYAIVGHSERREYNGESSDVVGKKFKAACDNGLLPILCVGETLAQREAEKTFDVIASQLHAVVEHCGLAGVARGIVAYEPIWAIGTGKSATPAMAQEVHAYIREVLGPEGEHTAILYGGSVKPDTAAALFEQPDIDGALVGGASLKASDFLSICRAAE